MRTFPTSDDITQAAQRIAPHAHHTPVLRSRSFDALTGAELHFKCENFQRAGAFKFRGACNAVYALSDEAARHGVVTHSAGNHGAALALAARTRGIAAHVVVPEGTVQSKMDAIRAYGATLHLCAPNLAAREEMCEQIRARTGAVLVHPFAAPLVIAGQGTAIRELIDESGPFDAVMTPVSGGGLIGGTAIAARERLPDVEIFAAEPEGAADAYLSMQRGVRVTDIVPDTICDGLRASIGAINFELLQRYSIAVLPVSDAEAIAAMRLMFERMKIVVEPSSATVLAAVLRHRDRFAGKRVGVIVSGGNVDLDRLPWLA
ncbi:MAG TPA: pyridoxal-phosphate dependent enzyme [Rudaea sp.]